MAEADSDSGPRKVTGRYKNYAEKQNYVLFFLALSDDKGASVSLLLSDLVALKGFVLFFYLESESLNITFLLTVKKREKSCKSNTPLDKPCTAVARFHLLISIQM